MYSCPKVFSAHGLAQGFVHSTVDLSRGAYHPYDVPLVIGVGASKMPPAHHGMRKGAAPTKLRQALMRGILRGAGGIAKRPVQLMAVNEYRTTVCCSCCRAPTTVPLVHDYRTHQLHRSWRLRECRECGWRCQVMEEEEGEGVLQGEVQAAQIPPSSMQGSRVSQSRRGYRMHRDLTAAWNLWGVTAAEYGGQPRPEHLQLPQQPEAAR